MAFKVIRPFKDLTDPEKHDYVVDDSFPRDGHKPSEEFITGLVTGFNSAGSVFLMIVDDEPELQTKNEVTNDESDKPELQTKDEVTEEAPAEKPKRKRTTKKAEA